MSELDPEALAKWLEPDAFDNRRRSPRNHQAAARCRAYARKLAKKILKWHPLVAALRAPPASPTGRQLGPGKRDELPPIVSEGVGGHTPGPWTLSGPPVARDPRVWIYAPDGPNRPRIATVDHVFLCDEEAVDTNYANARLIAAAPDLLGACRGLIKLCEGHTAPGDLTPLSNARSALSKATGEGG